MAEASVASLVIDNGSSTMKVGYAGDDSPRSVFPTVLGNIKNPVFLVGMNRKDEFVGNEAQARRGMLALRYPINNGFITSWDDMEKLWHYCLEPFAPSSLSILLTEPPLNPSANREKMTQIMFETFLVPSLMLKPCPVLSLYTVGRTDGCVLESGDGITHIVPIHESSILSHAVLRLDLAGRDSTEYLKNLCNERGYSFTTGADREIVRDMKEKLSYVALQYERELETALTTQSQKSYELPDGSIVSLGNERFKCAEILFNPSLLGRDMHGVHTCIYQCINKCDENIRSQMYANIVLGGGGTLFPGMVERLTRELTNLVPSTTKIKILAPSYRQNSAWLGGSILASSNILMPMWTTKAEYDEIGPSVILNK